jgi:hypothetical protein
MKAEKMEACVICLIILKGYFAAGSEKFFIPKFRGSEGFMENFLIQNFSLNLVNPLSSFSEKIDDQKKESNCPI